MLLSYSHRLSFPKILLSLLSKAGDGSALRTVTAPVKAVTVKAPEPPRASSSSSSSSNPEGHVGPPKRSSRSRIDPKKLPSEVSVLEIRVALVRKVRGQRYVSECVDAFVRAQLQLGGRKMFCSSADGMG